jgi:hypothetical protein
VGGGGTGLAWDVATMSLHNLLFFDSLFCRYLRFLLYLTLTYLRA